MCIAAIDTMMTAFVATKRHAAFGNSLDGDRMSILSSTLRNVTTTPIARAEKNSPSPSPCTRP